MAHLRNADYVYHLAVDPDRLKPGNSIQSWVLDILVKNGGTMPRRQLVDALAKVLARRRKNLNMPASSVLSHHQRVLRDQGLIRITNAQGRTITTKPRKTLVS